MSHPELERIRGVGWSHLEGLAGRICPGLGELLSGEPAERVVDRLLRANRNLSGEQRRAVVEALFGVAVWRRRILFHSQGSEPSRLLFVFLRDLVGLTETEAARLAEWSGTLPTRPPPEVLADRYSLPDWLAQGLAQTVGEEAPQLAAALNLPGPVCLRANRLKTSREALQEQLRLEGVATRAGRYARECLVVESPRPNILNLPSYRDGLFEVQDEGSQLLGELLEVVPGERVLDLCAGAGGKTLQLASCLENRGELHAYDIDAEKLSRLRQRAARAGVNLLAIHTELPANLRVDRVLVDAPCSELGVLRRGPDRRFFIQPSDFVPLPDLQRQLLETGLRHLRPGGRLVYATCTFRREENEEVATAFQRQHPMLRRVRPGEGWLSADLIQDGYFRSYPHRHGTDGFFAAVYQYAP